MTLWPAYVGLKRAGKPFARALGRVARRVELEPQWLATVIDFETGGTWSPSKENEFSQATGLLQWLPSTARLLGTTVEALASMSRFEQLPYVERTYAPWRGKVRSLGDAYLAIFAPDYVGDPPLMPIAFEGDVVYEQNPLPKATPGVLTVGDVVAVIERHRKTAKTWWSDAPGSAGAGSSSGEVGDVAIFLLGMLGLAWARSRAA